MASPGEPSADVAGYDPKTAKHPPVPPTPHSEPAAASPDHSPGTIGQQRSQTVPIAVEVPKGKVLMAVTPTEAEALERSRIQASTGRLFRWMPRDWTTPLALLIPLVAALGTNISDQGVRIGFFVATVLAAIWLTLAVIGRVANSLKARSDRQRRRPVLK